MFANAKGYAELMSYKYAVPTNPLTKISNQSFAIAFQNYSKCNVWKDRTQKRQQDWKFV